jgi:hypothetical protein
MIGSLSELLRPDHNLTLNPSQDDAYPSVPMMFVDLLMGPLVGRIGKASRAHGNLVWLSGRVPKQRRATCRTEVVDNRKTAITAAAIDPRLS